MNLLLSIEELFKKDIDTKKMELNLRQGLRKTLEAPEVRNELINVNLFDESKYKIEFSGIKLSILNYPLRQPYFRACLVIQKKHTLSPIAWYEQEYDSTGRILDDFFDWI